VYVDLRHESLFVIVCKRYVISCQVLYVEDAHNYHSSPWTDIRVICPLLASGVSVLVLVTAYATKLQRRATKPIPVPSVDRNILVWNVTKAAATLVLLSLTVFTAFVFGLDASTTVNASLGFATVCTPLYRVTDYFTRAHNDTTDICSHPHSQCRLAHQ
jgi:hypothetical protein